MDIFKDEELNKPKKQQEKTNLVKGEYMSLNLGASETEMIMMLNEYNTLCKKFYPKIISWNYSDLFRNSLDPRIKLTDWKMFILDSRVRNWLNDEIYLMNKQKQVELLNKLGADHSTATVQALSTIIKANENEDDRIDDSKIYIYSFMPLTDQERRLNNVNILGAIPDEVKDAIQYIPAGNDNK